MISKSQKKAVQKYESKAYDKILLRVKKGERDLIQAKAVEAGESLNGYIINAVKNRMSE